MAKAAPLFVVTFAAPAEQHLTDGLRRMPLAEAEELVAYAAQRCMSGTIVPVPAERTDATDVLFTRDEVYRDVHEFLLRGRRYTMTTGCVSHREGESSLPVFNAAGKLTRITVKSTDRVEVLSRR